MPGGGGIEVLRPEGDLSGDQSLVGAASGDSNFAGSAGDRHQGSERADESPARVGPRFGSDQTEGR